MKQGTRILADFRALNLASGTDFRAEFWNVDLDLRHDLDQFVDVFGTLPWESERFDRIVAYDILEHASWRKTENVLSEWVRVLAPGGSLELRVPNMLWLCQAWANGDIAPAVLLDVIYGGQDTPDWTLNAHHSGFGPELLRAALICAGLEIEKLWSETPNLLCIARKPCRSPTPTAPVSSA